MSLNTTTSSSSIQSGESNTFGAVAVPSENFLHQSASVNNPLVNGTGSGQANHAVSFNVATSTGGVTIDLTALTGDGLDGKSRDFSNGGSGGAIKDILIENTDPTNTITISQPASNGWTGFSGAATGFSYPIEPGGHIHLYSPVSGKAVGSTNKQFVLTSSAGTPNARISAVGIAA